MEILGQLQADVGQPLPENTARLVLLLAYLPDEFGEVGPVGAGFLDEDGQVRFAGVE